MHSITVQTTSRTEAINVTERLSVLLDGIQNGLAFFSVPHTTAALVICEDDDELRDDLVKVAENLFAAQRPFQHIKKNNPNAEAHIFTALAGTSLVLAVEGGALALGIYQNILLIELDGPKSREIRCKIIEDAG